MPKQPLFESFRHQFLLTGRFIAERERLLNPNTYVVWKTLIESLIFKPKTGELIDISWTEPKRGTLTVDSGKLTWYFRGDTTSSVKKQKEMKMMFREDTIFANNRKWFIDCVEKIGKQTGILTPNKDRNRVELDEQMVKHFLEEEKLFDSWALHTNPARLDVVHVNETCTAPEMRFITKRIGDIKGKTILDIGSGLGEASVYFALKGAKVTALDLSLEMLNTTKKLAAKYKVQVETVQSTVEYLHIPKAKKFDIIYGGNIFHHVDIPNTFKQLLPHMKPGGKLVCWEPVAYNPLINWYRKIATAVRSDDESPITLKDIDLFRSYFKNVEVKWFWLTTLIIFCFMYVFMRRDPNKIRFWKKVVEEGSFWKPLYLPLEYLDKLLLFAFPFLGPLCWNVVLICSKPRK